MYLLKWENTIIAILLYEKIAEHWKKKQQKNDLKFRRRKLRNGTVIDVLQYL